MEGSFSLHDLTEEQKGLVARGCCPFCEYRILDWQMPRTKQGMELWLKKVSVDASVATGHQISCDHQGLTVRSS